SALTLKLLISHRYGSIVAAPTFSLPEHIGGERNWDYRYTWIRDASFTVYSLMHLGYIKEMEKFMQWVEKLFQHMPQGGGLKLMYTVAGNKEVDEQILDHLEGYKRSEEHTSELQSRENLVCRLLLEKKNDCCVDAARVMREDGDEIIMVSCNRETVSTDYVSCDRLYVELVTLECRLEIESKETPRGG